MGQYHQETPVELRITLNSTASGPVGASIKIVDRMSRQTLIDVDVTGQDFAELLASRQVIAMAEVPSIANFAKVGMREEVYKLTEKDYPSNWPDNWRRDAVYDKTQPYTHTPKDYHEEFGQYYIEKNGWDTYSWHYHNYGWDMIVRRHVDATDEERQARLDPHNW